ncbi:sugar transporter [Luteimonas marina]|uniref:Sugar transporter n=1 Tax=Luteimonas marina TaxID=488485 RepID=A0A5C5TZ60_9GAMM|nr:sugar transporter [Luteimonas marina]TWT19056.1 sugar transporter [Luteimonas marina]
MTASKPPVLFWIIAVLAVLWNLAGTYSFYYHLSATPEIVASWADDQQRIFAAMPRWLFVPFAVATVGGLVGSLGLLWRSRWAVPVLALSLLAIIVQFAGNYLTTPLLWELTGARGALFPLVIALVGLFLWWYARRAAARGWLR